MKAVAVIWWLVVSVIILLAAFLVTHFVNDSIADIVVWVAAGILVFAYGAFGLLFASQVNKAERNW